MCSPVMYHRDLSRIGLKIYTIVADWDQKKPNVIYYTIR